MKNIHILPTDKPSRLVKFFTNKLHLCKEILPIQDEEQYQHIYITSNEEIKDVRPHKGKWQLEKGEILNKFPNYLTDLSECKLVIITTDPDLIKDGVQPIDDEFLEWFVKNPTCEEVEVILNEVSYVVEDNIYKIIIPKEEPTEEAKQRAKNYMSLKGALEPKQETTLEEYISEVTKNFGDEMSIKFTSGGIKLGAKWQAERMYSEEDLLSAFEAGMMFIGEDKRSFKEWFEQNKKK